MSEEKGKGGLELCGFGFCEISVFFVFWSRNPYS